MNLVHSYSTRRFPKERVGQYMFTLHISCLVYTYNSSMELRRGGMTPACGSVNARSGRGCSGQIEAVNATDYCEGVTSIFESGCVEKEQKEPTIHPAPYAPTYAYLVGWKHHAAPHPSGFTRRRAASIFAPCLVCVIQRLFACGEGALTARITATSSSSSLN